VALAGKKNLRVGHSNLFAFPIFSGSPFLCVTDAGLFFLLDEQLDEAVIGKDLLLDPSAVLGIFFCL
jgi:hypothetical protein